MAIFSDTHEVEVVGQKWDTRQPAREMAHYVVYRIKDTGETKESPVAGARVCWFADGGLKEIDAAIQSAAWFTQLNDGSDF